MTTETDDADEWPEKPLFETTTAEVVEHFAPADDTPSAAADALIERVAFQGAGRPVERTDREKSTKLLYHFPAGGAGIMPGLWDGLDVRLTEVFHADALDEDHPHHDADRPIVVCLVVYGTQPDDARRVA